MSAPTNSQQMPEPSNDWRGTNQVDPDQAHSLNALARLWRPARTIMEVAVATLCRVAHRVVDRTTGIPYSADELTAKMLADLRVEVETLKAQLVNGDYAVDLVAGSLTGNQTVTFIDESGYAAVVATYADETTAATTIGANDVLFYNIATSRFEVTSSYLP